MIEIQKFEMVNKGALIARFNVKMHKWGGLVIKDCSLFESGDRKWINLPSRQYEVDGKKKYASYLAYEDRDLDDKFKKSILDAAVECKPKVPNQNQYKTTLDDEIPF